MKSKMLIIAGLMGILLLVMAALLSVIAWHAIPHPFNFIFFGILIAVVVFKIAKSFNKK